MAKPPPILARVFRGDRVESLHRGSVAVVDERARLVAWAGDPGGIIFLRSAAKPIQALPLLEAGGFDRYRLGNREVALMCASHGGEPRHIAVARRLLARGGFAVGDLACGPHPPMHEPSAARLVRRGERPTALHNNCSGKHAGLLLACRLLGFAPGSYWRASHPIQVRILARLASLSSVSARRIGIAVDGCNLPVFALPLRALALSYARLVSRGLPGESAAQEEARRRVVRAMVGHPEMVAGAGRFTSDFLEAGRGAWIGKEGAEGVYGIALCPRWRGDPALGIAYKIEDGSSRARDAVALELLERLGRLGRRGARLLGRHRAPRVLNSRGIEVGRIQAEVSIMPGSVRRS
jgi:L-asparaginase II